jgi:hypothetical protein
MADRPMNRLAEECQIDTLGMPSVWAKCLAVLLELDGGQSLCAREWIGAPLSRHFSAVLDKRVFFFFFIFLVSCPQELRRLRTLRLYPRQKRNKREEIEVRSL